MPNGDDQVQVQMPDGRILTGPKSGLPTALKMGAKLYTPQQQSSVAPQGQQPGIIDRASQALTGQTPSELWKNTKAEVANPKGIPGDIARGTGMLATGAANLVAHPFETTSKLTAAPTLQEDIKNKNYRGAVGDVIGGGINAYGLIKGAGELTPEAKTALRETEQPAQIAEKSTTQAKSVLSSIFNEGATREKMQLLQDSDALATKAKIYKIDKAVEDDAGNLMQKTSQAIDQKSPEGSIDPKLITQTIKKGLGDKVKAKSLQNLPPSLQKIMNEATGGTGKSTATRLTSSEMQTLNILMKEGATGEGLRGGLVDMGYAPKQIDAMMQIAEGGAGKSNMWKFERAKQLRTELGKDLFANPPDKYPGQMRSVMFDTWKQLTDQLDSAAEKAGLKDDWTRGKQKYTDYMKDFYGTYERGKYNQSPLDMVLKGQNSKEIMEPLSGEDAQLARDILKKYGSYGVDPKEILSDVRRYGTNKKIMQFASPSKYDIIIGGMALYRPEYGIPMFIARYGLPRAMERIAARRATGLEAARPSAASIPETAP